MTNPNKLALFLAIEAYKNGDLPETLMRTAVDAYSAAIVADSQCSTLRAAIEQKFNEVHAAHEAAEGSEKDDRFLEMSVLIGVLSLIDELQPVA